MAGSPCGGTGFSAPGKFCTLCSGNPFTNSVCAEARRRGQGIEVSKVFESPSMATGSMTRVVRHPLGRVPAVIQVYWSKVPYHKAAKAGDPEPPARTLFTEARRETGEVEFTLDHSTGAEPGEFRLILIA